MSIVHKISLFFIFYSFLLLFCSLGCAENEARDILSPIEVNLTTLLQAQKILPEGSLATQMVVQIGGNILGTFPITVEDVEEFIPGTFGETNVSVDYQDDRDNELYHGTQLVEINKVGITDVPIKLCPVNHEITALFTITRGSGEVKVGELVAVDASASSSTHFSQESLWVKWDWGDGVSTNFPLNKKADHRYQTCGRGQITLTVKDNLDDVEYDRDTCGNIENVATFSEFVEVLPCPKESRCVDFSSLAVEKGHTNFPIDQVSFSLDREVRIVIIDNQNTLPLFEENTVKIELPERSNQMTIIAQGGGGGAQFRDLNCGGEVVTEENIKNAIGDIKIILAEEEICFVHIIGQEFFVEELCYEF